MNVYYWRTWYEAVCGGKGGSEGHVLRVLLAAACVDESDHLTLVNAGDEEVVSQEEGGREGSAAGGEEGGCCCASAIAIAHMRLAHRARENKYMDSA